MTFCLLNIFKFTGTYLNSIFLHLQMNLSHVSLSHRQHKLQSFILSYIFTMYGHWIENEEQSSVRQFDTRLRKCCGQKELTSAVSYLTKFLLHFIPSSFTFITFTFNSYVLKEENKTKKSIIFFRLGFVLVGVEIQLLFNWVRSKFVMHP